MTDKKAGSESQGSRVQKSAAKPFDRPSSNDEPAQSLSQAAVAPEVKAERPSDVKKKPASKPSAVKREYSDIFKSFSKPKTKLKHDDAAIQTSASAAPDTAPPVSNFFSFQWGDL